MPTLTVRSFHPDSGALLGNISVLDFGKVTIGTHSNVKVIDIAFQDVTVVGNVKIGLISSGGITVATATSKHFGIVSSPDFTPSKVISTDSASHFQGINSDGTASNSNNVSISMRSNTISNYIYLDIELGSTNVAAGNGAYKIFFDFS